MNTVEYINEHKIITICRRLYGDKLLKLARALCDGGVRLMEVTFDQKDADCLQKTAQGIRELCRKFGDDMRFGAGTVLTEEQVSAAAAAGAKYIISPNTNTDIIRKTKELGLVSIPGAMTPSEIMAAHDTGADFVKLFPAGYLGFSYIKDILAPISHVKLIATGGVNESNFCEYLRLGFAGAGISGRLADKALIEAGDYAELTRRARIFCDMVRSRGERQ